MSHAAGRVILSCVALFAAIIPIALAQAPAPPSAGQVTAQIPEGLITRPKEIMAANVGAEVLWNDLLVTRPGGRMRVTLLDTSVLNVGPGASLRVTKHDLRTRETEVTLTYGKMRSRVAKESDPKKFEVKTNTAVLGVVGTDFYTESSLVRTAVVVYEGIVRVRSIDPAIPGETLVHAGESLVIGLGQPPGPARPATAAELNDSLRETEVGTPLPTPSLPALASGQPPTPPPTAPSLAPATRTAAGGGADPWRSAWQIYGQGFSADQVMRQGSQQHRMRMYMRENASRMEMSQQGQQIITIVRFDRGVAWTLMPDQQMYMETSLDPSAQRNVAAAMRDSGAQSETEMLGIEQVGGYQCQKYRYRTTSQGQTYTGTVWTALSLNGFPIKIVDDKSGAVIEYENIRLGPPDASLFEVPPGYRKVTY